MKNGNFSYLDKVHRWGTVWNLSVMVVLLASRSTELYSKYGVGALIQLSIAHFCWHFALRELTLWEVLYVLLT